MNSQYRYIKAAILLGLGIFLIVKLIDGSLYFYINRRFTWLTIFGAVSFILLAIASFFNEDHHHDHDQDHEHEHNHGSQVGVVLIISIPLLLGFLLPAQPLDTNIIQTKGISNIAPLIAQGNQTLELDQPADNRTILDWVRLINYSENPSEFTGETASVIGFVFHDMRLTETQFMVGRIGVTCCVADAFAIGLIVEWPESTSMTDNSWVHVEGKMEVIYLDGRYMPMIVADKVKPTDPPPEPYLYP